MNDKILKQIADRIKNYLQNDCASEWHIELKEKSITAYYTNTREFILDFDEDFEDWYISGNYINIEMITEINKILREVNYAKIY